MEDSFALFQHPRARFAFRGHCPTVLVRLGLPALGRFPQFSAFAKVYDSLMHVEAENSRNRPNMAISPYLPLAVALLQYLRQSTKYT